MRYRGRTDITVQILEAANDGVTKTKIMYKAFLSYAQLKEYLAALIENDLLDTMKLNKFMRLQTRVTSS